MPHQHLVALAVGFALDLALGDPHGWPHPVVWIGRLISWLEGLLRSAFPKTPAGERAAGATMAVLVVAASWGACALALGLAALVWPPLSLALECVVCYQMLATRSLRVESMRVCRALEAGDLAGAREAVSMIVGRDTAALDAAGVTRAAVETVAENSSDGVVAPMLFMALGGAPLGVAYKAVNTMDSMVGYRNERYRHFGTAAARADDVANLVPARVTGALMCAAAGLVGLDAAGAWRVMRRDHARHASPNSAWTEAACAGALGVRLAGDASYFGEVVHKPWIGDDDRPVEPADVRRANRLLLATAGLAAAACLALSWAVSTVWEVPLWL